MLTELIALTFDPIESISRELIVGGIRSSDDDGVTALDSRGAAEIGAVVGALALWGDIRCEKYGWWRGRAEAEGKRPCGADGREERYDEAELEEKSWGVW
jgi:hypothetical protein